MFKAKKNLFLLIFFIEFIFSLFVIPWLDFLQMKSPPFDYRETFTSYLFLCILIVPLVEEFLFRYVLRYQRVMKFVSRNKWRKVFPFLVYFSVFIFAFIHIFNFEGLLWWHYLFFFFIVISQILGGFFLSFLRVRLSFYWSVGYHCFWNFFVLLISYFSLMSIEVKTENYTIKIEEKMFFDKNKLQKIVIDFSKDKINRMKIEQYSVQQLLDTLYGKGVYYVDDALLYLDF